jgi:hypothetical protein
MMESLEQYRIPVENQGGIWTPAINPLFSKLLASVWPVSAILDHMLGEAVSTDLCKSVLFRPSILHGTNRPYTGQKF